MSRIHSLFFLPLVLILAACGGGGGGSSNETDPSQDPVDENRPLKGTFIDGHVEGLAFKTKTQSGYTNERGGFEFLDGEVVTFSIGDVVIGTAAGASTVTPFEMLSATEDYNSPSFLNIIRLLQTLDADRDHSTGIQIPLDAHLFAEGITIAFDVTTTDFENNQAVLDLVSNTTGLNALISTSQAMENWKSSLSRLFFYIEHNDPDFPYSFVSYDGSKVIPQYDNGAFIGAVLETRSGDQIHIEMNADGTPKSIVSEGIYLQFTNYNQDTFDIGIVFEDGSVETILGVSNVFPPQSSERLTQPRTAAKAGMSSKLPAAPLEVDSAKADAILSSTAASLIAKQLSQEIDLIIEMRNKLNFPKSTRLQKILTTELLKSATIEIALQAAADIYNVNYEELKANTQALAIVVSGASCLFKNKLACFDLILSSVSSTAEATRILLDIREQNGTNQRLAEAFVEKELLGRPIINVVHSITGTLLFDYYGEPFFIYLVDLDYSGTQSDIDPNAELFIKLPGYNPQFYPSITQDHSRLLLPPGVNTLDVEVKDEFGLTSIDELVIDLPQLPEVENDEIDVGPNDFSSTNPVRVLPSGRYDFETVPNQLPSKGTVVFDLINQEYTYTASLNAEFGNDSFKFQASLQLDDCIESASFDCTVQSVPATVNVTILRPEQRIVLANQTSGPFDFGQVKVGASNTLTFTIGNTGNAELTIDQTLSSNSSFKVLSFDSIIPAGGSGSLVVEFSPETEGEINASITVWSNDISSPYDLMLTGEGQVEPDISIVIDGQEYSVISPPPAFSFGEVNVGATASPVAIVLRNTGSSELIIENVFHTSPNQISTFELSGRTPEFGIQPTNNEIYQLSFTPPDTGSFETGIRINSNDPDESELTPLFSGTGVDTEAPEIEITFPVNNDVISEAVLIASSASDNTSIKNVSYFLDDKDVSQGGVFIGSSTEGPEYTVTLDPSAYQHGDHQLVAVATDVNDNENVASISISIVNAATPDILITSVSPLTVLDRGASSTTTISAESSDNANTQKVDFYLVDSLDQEFLIGTDTNAPYELVYDTSQLYYGTYQIKAVVSDLLDETSTHIFPSPLSKNMNLVGTWTILNYATQTRELLLTRIFTVTEMNGSSAFTSSCQRKRPSDDTFSACNNTDIWHTTQNVYLYNLSNGWPIDSVNQSLFIVQDSIDYIELLRQ